MKIIDTVEEKSPRVLARLTGLFALLEALTSGFGQVIIPRMLIVPGNVAGTAANVLVHGPLFRLSILAAFLGVACHIVWTYLVYELFKPVSRNLALVAVLFSLVAIALQGFSGTLQAAPQVALQAGPALAAFNAEQLKTLAFVFLSLNARVFDGYLVFFGFWCVLIGYLIFRSTFMPRILGLLEGLAGLCWLTFIWPPLAHYVSPYNQILAGLGEISLMLWLLVMGVNVERWKEQASAG
jgi:hypothetical protein